MVEQELTHLLQQRLRFSKRTSPAQAAVLIAITNEHHPKVLLTRRSTQLSNHAGEVSFPGGKRDAGDTSNIVVALREAQEETALNPFVDLIAQPIEIDRIFFASLNQLLSAPATPYEVKYAHQSLYFPSLQVENEVIWGLTARMLISLFHYGLNYQKDWPFLLNSPHFQPRKF